MAPDEFPDTMTKLPRGGRHRLPVPYVAAWSCERWHAIRHDPVVGDVAIFTAGRYARGRALFGVTNEPRQRECVMLRRCGVCGQSIDGPGWLPNHDRLIEQIAEVGGQRLQVTHEPPCCLPCARWSATGCLAIRGRTPDLLRIDAFLPIAQRVDPSRGPSRHDARFDGPDDLAERERLGRIARRHGGVIGYVKLGLIAAEAVPLGAVG